MKATFVSQPFSGGPDMRSYIADCAADTGLSHLDIVVAWAKRSGLRLVDSDLRAFRGRGGTIRMIVGVSEGGATRQGLELTRSLADEAFVLHVPGRTFHPKVFVATGVASARLLVGSQNMTAGGARTNYEAGLDLELDRSDAGDEAMLQAVNDWVDDLLADTAVCLRLDAGLLAKLIADPRYRIGDEDAPKPGSKTPEDSDSVVEDGPSAGPGLFGKSKYQLKSSSASPTVGSSGPSGGSSAPLAPPPAGTGPAPASGTSATVAKRWYKQLKAADAQQLGGTSNPSGHVTLVNAGHAIDKRVYFRHDFFGAETWNPQGAKNEVCTINADVVIDGKPMGTRSFTVQHTPAFEAGQGNRSTVLHWDSLSSQIKAISYVNEYLTLEKFASGGYRLTIAPSQVGPFIK